MGINVSERFLHPVELARLLRGGLLLPEQILLIRQKATRTVCPLSVFHGVFQGVGWLWCGAMAAMW